MKTKKLRFGLFSLARFFLISFFGFLLLSFSVFLYFIKDLPRPEKFTEKQLVQSTKIYDRTGEILLYEIYGEERRTFVILEKIPDFMKKAVIATEDKNFYDHFGIDLKGIARSVLINFRIGTFYGVGGSTIPQQLIRSTFFSNDKTIERKLREIILSLELDRRYSKEQILEWYLNQVPFGSNSYGVEAASQTYFKKSISEISLAQSATLAALIQSPSHLSPYGDYKDKLLRRKDFVLDQMLEEGFITKEEAEVAKKEELIFENSKDLKAPHFVIYIIENYLKPKYGEDLNYLKSHGMNIYTSIDLGLQEFAEKAVKDQVKINRESNAYNAALVALDPKTGEILAMVGSADWNEESYPKGCISGKDCLFDPQFNAAVGTKNNPGRQPGSSFKPFAYVTAFEKGYNDNTLVLDELTNFGQWGGEDYIPQNYDGKFRGPVTLRSALAQSLNIPAVKTVLDLAGINETVKTAQSLGISTLKPPFGPSIVLGGWEVRLLDMVSAFGAFAREGEIVPPAVIIRVEDSNGQVLEQNQKTPKRVLSTESTRILNSVLSDNEARAPMFGYNSALSFPGYDVAAKTGTTQSYKDGWAIGYTPFMVVGVWAGNNDNSPMIREPGVVSAGPIFHKVMEKALLGHPREDFIDPQSTNPLLISSEP